MEDGAARLRPFFSFALDAVPVYNRIALPAKADRPSPGGNMKEVKGARVLITGGARGMGLLWAEKFLAEGASVMLWDRDKAALDGAALKLLAEHPGKVGAAAVDVSDNE